MLYHFSSKPNLFLLIAIFLRNCNSFNAKKGLVYYPPYSDPFNRENDPCLQVDEWNFEPGTDYLAPKLDPQGTNNCLGSLNGVPFAAPRFQLNVEPPSFEEIAIGGEEDEISEIFALQRLRFTCRDRSGTVKQSSLYYWTYAYRALLRRSITVRSYERTMRWDIDGKMLFQPLSEPRPGNISCYYYDPAQGYFVHVRTWRLVFGGGDQLSDTVQIVSCSSELANLHNSKPKIDVLVTSSRLDFAIFCPLSTCSMASKSTRDKIPSYCESNPHDPSSYLMCRVDPLKIDHVSYNCTSSRQHGSPTIGNVRINLRSGARFTHDDDFKQLLLLEGNRDQRLNCTVNPGISTMPKWQRFVSATKQYEEIVDGDDFEVYNDLVTGLHHLTIRLVQLSHEGSYRCVVSQTAASMKTELPIYGYYFVKVYPEPKQCVFIDAETNETLLTNGSSNIITVDLRKTRQIVMSCSNLCKLCGPVVLLYKNGQLCSTRNVTNEERNLNSCGGQETVSLDSTSPLKISLTLARLDQSFDSTTLYNISLVYRAPIKMQTAFLFLIKGEVPTTTSITTTTTMTAAEETLLDSNLIQAMSEELVVEDVEKPPSANLVLAKDTSSEEIQSSEEFGSDSEGAVIASDSTERHETSSIIPETPELVENLMNKETDPEPTTVKSSVATVPTTVAGSKLHEQPENSTEGDETNLDSLVDNHFEPSSDPTSTAETLRSIIVDMKLQSTVTTTAIQKLLAGESDSGTSPFLILDKIDAKSSVTTILTPLAAHLLKGIGEVVWQYRSSIEPLSNVIKSSTVIMEPSSSAQPMDQTTGKLVVMPEMAQSVGITVIDKKPSLPFESTQQSMTEISSLRFHEPSLEPIVEEMTITSAPQVPNIIEAKSNKTQDETWSLTNFLKDNHVATWHVVLWLFLTAYVLFVIIAVAISSIYWGRHHRCRATSC